MQLKASVLQTSWFVSGKIPVSTRVVARGCWVLLDVRVCCSIQKLHVTALVTSMYLELWPISCKQLANNLQQPVGQQLPNGRKPLSLYDCWLRRWGSFGRWEVLRASTPPHQNEPAEVVHASDLLDCHRWGVTSQTGNELQGKHSFSLSLMNFDLLVRRLRS